MEHLGLDRADGLALVRDLDAWGISDQGIQRLASREYTNDFMTWVRSCSSNPYGDSAAMRALTGTTIDGGGATVPLEMIGEIIQRRRAMNRVSSQVRRFQTSSDRVSIPKHSGDELSVQWVGAQGSVSEDTSLQDFNSVGIDVHRGGCLVVADRAWLEDSAFDMEGWIAEQIAYMYAKMLDDIIINGTGVGRPFGLATRTGTTTPADNLITCVNIGDDPTFTGLLTLLGTLPEGYLDNASWIWKRLTLFSKIFTLRDTNGQPLFGTNTTLAGGATGRVDAQLLGYPVIQSERMAASGAGAKDTYFGDLRAAYALVERVALSIEPYVDPAIQKKDQRGWYVRFRIGGDVLDETAVLCGLET